MFDRIKHTPVRYNNLLTIKDGAFTFYSFYKMSRAHSQFLEHSFKTQ